MFLFGRLMLAATLFASLAFCGSVRGQGVPNFVTPAEQAAGWKLLFDGKTVTGFRGLTNPDFLKAGWVIQDGVLSLPKTIDQSGKVTGGDLASLASYTDFEFAFEWKLTVSGASGILYGARAGFGMTPTGYEFQIIDDVHHPDGLKGGPIRRTGALYGILPPGPNKRINESGWNNGRIVVKGAHVEHWVNGEKVLEYDFASPELMAAIRASNLRTGPGFGLKTGGVILLRDKGEEVAFRSLKIRPFAPAPAATPAATAAAAPAIPARGGGPTPFKSRIPIPGESN